MQYAGFRKIILKISIDCSTVVLSHCDCDFISYKFILLYYVSISFAIISSTVLIYLIQHSYPNRKNSEIKRQLKYRCVLLRVFIIFTKRDYVSKYNRFVIPISCVVICIQFKVCCAFSWFKALDSRSSCWSSVLIFHELSNFIYYLLFTVFMFQLSL